MSRGEGVSVVSSIANGFLIGRPSSDRRKSYLRSMKPLMFRPVARTCLYRQKTLSKNSLPVERPVVVVWKWFLALII